MAASSVADRDESVRAPLSGSTLNYTLAGTDESQSVLDETQLRSEGPTASDTPAPSSSGGNTHVVFLFAIANCAMWAAQTVAFWQVGINMPNSPIFSSWFSYFPYLIILPPLFFWERRNNRLLGIPPVKAEHQRKAHLCYLLIGFMMALCLTSEFVAAPHVPGFDQALLQTVVPLPMTAVIVFFMLGRRFTKWELIGSAIVMAASALRFFDPSGASSSGTVAQGSSLVFWLAFFSAGVVVGCVYGAIWEAAFEWYGSSPIELLWWSMLYSALFHAIAVWATYQAGIEQPFDGLRCFFEIEPLPDGCRRGAWLPVSIYIVTGILQEIMQVYFVSYDGAYTLMIADALGLPVAALVLSSRGIFGTDAESLSVFSIVSLVLIVVGIIAYKFDDLREAWNAPPPETSTAGADDELAAMDSAAPSRGSRNMATRAGSFNDPSGRVGTHTMGDEFRFILAARASFTPARSQVGRLIRHQRHVDAEAERMWRSTRRSSWDWERYRDEDSSSGSVAEAADGDDYGSMHGSDTSSIGIGGSAETTSRSAFDSRELQKARDESFADAIAARLRDLFSFGSDAQHKSPRFAAVRLPNRSGLDSPAMQAEADAAGASLSSAASSAAVPLLNAMHQDESNLGRINGDSGAEQRAMRR